MCCFWFTYCVCCVLCSCVAFQDEYDDDELIDSDFYEVEDAFRLFSRMFSGTAEESGGASENPAGGFSVDGMVFSAEGRIQRSGTVYEEECDCPKCQRRRDPERYREAVLETLYERRHERILREESKIKPPSFKYAKDESDINLDWLDEIEEKESHKNGSKEKNNEKSSKKKKKMTKAGGFMCVAYV